MLWINHANTPVSTRRQQIPHLSVNNKDHETENEFATKQKHPLMLDVCTSPSLRHYEWVCEFLWQCVLVCPWGEYLYHKLGVLNVFSEDDE